MTESKNAVALTAEQIDAIMEQAQVFASAWSLVGGIFDSGNALETAEQEKANLRALLATPIEQAVGVLAADAPGTRMQIQDLIDQLVAIRDRFGNTAVYMRPNSVGWGATALNWQHQDEEAAKATAAPSNGDQE